MTMIVFFEKKRGVALPHKNAIIFCPWRTVKDAKARWFEYPDIQAIRLGNPMIYRVLNLADVVGLLPSNQSWMKDFTGKRCLSLIYDPPVNKR